jgi:hypothetical protein
MTYVGDDLRVVHLCQFRSTQSSLNPMWVDLEVARTGEVDRNRWYPTHPTHLAYQTRAICQAHSTYLG